MRVSLEVTQKGNHFLRRGKGGRPGSLKTSVILPPKLCRPSSFVGTLKRAVATEDGRFVPYEIELVADDQAPATPRPGAPYYTADYILESIASAVPVLHNRGLSMDTDNITSCGYFIRKDNSTQQYTRQELPLHDLLNRYRGLGWSFVPWDGVTSRPILDRDGRVIGVLAGRPDDPEYLQACRIAFQAINEEGDHACFAERHLKHQRGDFPAVNVGVTHRNGITKPVNYQNGQQLDTAMARLLGHPSLERISSFQDAAFKAWIPNLYEYYEQNLSHIWEQYPTLRPGFANSVWPCTRIDFGKRVYTKPHKVSSSLSFGWCSVIALGSFDPKRGGHLVLPDLNKIIEFPSGSTILIPSALLTQCNIPVAKNEERLSFTQFADGALFRFVEAGMQTESQLKKCDPKKYELLQAQRKSRLSEGLAKYRMMKRLPVC